MFEYYIVNYSELFTENAYKQKKVLFKMHKVKSMYYM